MGHYKWTVKDSQSQHSSNRTVTLKVHCRNKNGDNKGKTWFELKRAKLKINSDSEDSKF